VAFNNILLPTTSDSPVKTHGRYLSKIIEKLYVENAILRKDNLELRCQICSRKEQTKDKQLVLKDICAIATEEVQKVLEVAQKATQKGGKKGGKKGEKKGEKGTAKQCKKVSSSEEEDKEDTDNDSAEEAIEIQDCINVIAR
jgi:hypothetical protein